MNTNAPHHEATSHNHDSIFRLKPNRPLVLGLLLAGLATSAVGQVSLTTLGTPYTQNFDTLSAFGTPAWTDNTGLLGWYAQFGTSADPTAYSPSVGSGTSGGIYSYGASSQSTERALGSVASGGSGTIYYAVRLANDTGHTLDMLDIKYTGEQWRNSGNATVHKLEFEYRVGTASDANTPASVWVAATLLDFTGPVAGGTVGALNGNADANRVVKSATISVVVSAGQEIWLRWKDINDGGDDHGLAIDDLSVTPKAALQTLVNAAQPGGEVVVPPGEYSGIVINQPLTLRAATPGTVTINGASPALTVNSVVSVSGLTFATATADPTILVNSGGALTMRNCVVHESTSASAQPAIRLAAALVNPGTADLGTVGSPGVNTINIRGAGSLVRNETANNISAIGNTWQQDGAAITSNFTIEDNIYHALDGSGLGLTTWVDGNAYVTQNSGSLQRGIDAVVSGGRVNVQTGAYIDNPDATAKAIVLVPGSSPGQVIIMGDLTLSSDDTLEMELNGTAAGTTYDQLVVDGFVDLGSASLNVTTTGFAFAECDQLTLIDNDDIDAVTGTFAGLPAGTTVTVGAHTFRIRYDRGTGNDVVLVKDGIAPFVACLNPTVHILSGNPSVTVGAADVFNAAGSSDNCGGPVSFVSVSPSTFICAGVYSVTVTGTDVNDNLNTCTATVTVINDNPAPTVVYVDDGYVGLPNGTAVNFPYTGAGTHTIGCDAFASVQAGINAVAAGGTVNVAAGTYAEAVNANKSVMLLGANAGISGNVLLRGAESVINGGAGIAIDVTASGVTVDGFQLAGVTGLRAQLQTGTTVRNNVVQGGALGINVVGAVTPLEIRDNAVAVAAQEISGTPTVGINLSGVSGGAAATVQNNNITGPLYGYVLYAIGTSPTTAVVGGTITGVMQGVAVVNTIDLVTYSASTVNVLGTAMTGFTGSSVNPARNFHAGVYVFTGGADSTKSVTSTISVNVSGTGKPQQDSAGLYFADFSAGAGPRQNIQVESSSIVNNLNRGVYARGANAVVSIDQSYITGNGFDPFGAGGNDGFGIISRAGATMIVTESYIHNPSTVTAPYLVHAIGVEAGNLTVTGCSIENSGNANGKLATASGSINASGNWWGNNALAAIQAGLTGTVDFTPWLDNGVDTSANPAFQGDFTTLHVDDASPQLGGAEYIQEGVDMVSGSTVLLGPGSYSANVTIIGHVNILGSGSGNNPLVDSIVTAANAALPVIAINNAGGTSAANRLAIKSLRLLNGSDGIRVSATSGSHRFYDFDNLVATGHSGSGVAFTGTASLGDAIVATSTASNNGLYGVFVDSTLANFDTLLVTGCAFQDNAQNGLFFSGTEVNTSSPSGLQVVNSSFTNNGSPADPGSGDVSLYIFNGDAGLKNVAIASDGRYPIQIRGKLPTPPGPFLPAGVIGLTNVTVGGSTAYPALYIQRYSDVSNIRFDNVDLSAFTPAGWPMQMAVEHTGATPLNLGKLKLKTTYLGGPPSGYIALAMFNSGGALATCDTVILNAVDTQDLEDAVSDLQDTLGLGDVVFPAFNIACLASTPPTAECAGPGGTAVSYALPLATADCGPVSGVVCLPVSGSLFALGTTPVTCTATNGVGISTTCSFNVTVSDTTDPVIACSPDLNACSSSGLPIAVSFSVTATDGCDAAPTVVCVPASGSSFSIGTTLVTCTATDASGNDAICTFNVTVHDTSVAPSVVYVDDGYAGLLNCTLVNWPYTGAGALIIGYNAFATVQGGVNGLSVSGGTVNVAAGAYLEDVTVNKTASLLGAGAGLAILSGVSNGPSATIQAAASGIVIDGFTVTREGNNPAEWNNNLNSAGIAVQGAFTGLMVRNCLITGNRTGIDINNSSNHTVRNNDIIDNRTGLILRNVTDNLSIVENRIANNWTVGFVILDASGGTGSPAQTALNCTIKNNDISGNWYGQIVDRQTGGALPAPGANMKNFSGNWLGTVTPVVTTANSAEPGYAAQIPVVFGGTATPPGGQPDIAGLASANIDFTPWLHVGTDTDISTGFGTYGFQGDFSTLHVDDLSPQVGATGRIQEGVNLVTASTVLIGPGSYSENVVIGPALAVTLIGSGSGNNPLVDSIVTAANAALPVIAINDVGGASAASRLGIKNLRLLNGTEGLVVNATSGSHRFYDFDNLVSLNHPHSGIRFGGTASLGDALVSNSTASNNGLYGVFVDSTLASFDTLLVTGSTFADNDQAGVAVNGVDGVATSPTGVQLVNCGFASNGQVGNGGSGDVSFFLFNGDAGLKDLTITSDSRHPIQFRGKHTGGVLPVGLAAAGVVGLTNVTVTGTGNRPALYLHRYLSVNNVSLDDVDLSAYVPPLLPAGFAAQMMVEHYSATPMNLGKVTFKTTYLGGPVAGFHQALAMAGSGGAVASCDTVMINAVDTQDLEDGVLDFQDDLTKGDVVFPAFAIACAASTPSDAQCAGPGGTPVTYTLPTATAGCGPVSGVVCIPASGSLFGLGVTPVVCMATNGVGISTSCSFNVTVVDTVPPTITCPPDVAVNADLGLCVATGVALGTPTTSDICGVASIVNNAPSSFPVGTNLVTWTVTDFAGLTATCTQSVVVVDNQDPVIAAPADVSVNADLGQCSASGVMLGTPVTSDNCAVATVVNNAPSSFPVGVTIVTWTVTDVNGRTSTDFQTVTVIDDQDPVITCPANLELVSGSGCVAVINSFAASATDNCSYVITYKTNGIAVGFPASFSLGTTTVEATATDPSGNTDICTFTVKVIDLSGDVAANIPCWRGEDDTTFQHWAFSTSLDLGIAPESVTNSFGGPTADVLVGDLGYGWTDQDVPGLGCAQGTWDIGTNGLMVLTVPNTAGSASSYKYIRLQVTQFYIPLGYQYAKILISPSATLVSSNAQVLRPAGFGTLEVQETVWRVAPSPGGETITLYADGLGVQIDQVVVDTIALDYQCPANITQATDPGQCNAVVNYTPALPDGCILQANSCLPPSGSMFVVGTTTVNCTITDAESQSTSCSFPVTVNDTEPPLASCQNITVALSPVGSVTITGAQVNNGSSDNCGIASVVVAPDTFTCANLGANAVVLTVTDVHGLVSTCNATVTVQDVTPPVITTPGPLTANAAMGQCEASVAFAATATDACTASPVITYSIGVTPITSPNNFPVGVTTVTVVAADASGNSSTNSFTVTVSDTQAPVIGVITATQPQPATVNVLNCVADTLQGVVTITVTVSDNCPLALPPTITLLNGTTLATDSALLVGQVPVGPSTLVTYTFQWLVGATTDNGTWTATVSATDGSNPVSTTFTLCVNKAQISGLLQLQGFDGSAVGNSRTVTFVATDIGGVPLKTWNIPLSFTGDTAPYTLTGVPLATMNISAKTAWHKRRRLPADVAAAINNQVVVNFTGGSQLLGGDINNDNIVNFGDYLVLATHYNKDITLIPAADAANIDGNQFVNLLDYSILAANWFTVGDPQ